MAPAIELAHPAAENALLGCLINERMAPSTVIGLGLRRQDFAYEANSLVFDAIFRLVGRGAGVDEAVLLADMQANNSLDIIGGEEVIRKIASFPYDGSMLGQYVEVVMDRSMRRRLSRGFEASSRLLYTEPEGKVLLEKVQRELYRTIDEYMASSYMGIRGSDLAASWDCRHESGPRIEYPWRTAQAVLGGRARGDLSIWGLYTSDGKSTIALRNVVGACRTGLKVMFVLLEMTDEQITARLLAYMTKIDMGRLERDELSLEDKAKIDEAFKEIAEWDLTIYCDPAMDVADIRAVQMRERNDLIVVDYLQRMDFRDFSEVPRIAKQLKNIALTTKCTVDLFSQLTPKALDSRSQNPFSKPDNNSLYGGKATAFEADNVIFLWARREMDQDGGWNQRTGYGDLIFAKVRQGRPGLEVPMKFNHTTIQWEEAV